MMRPTWPQSRSLNHAEMDHVQAGLQRLGLRCCQRNEFLYFDVGRDGRVVFDALSVRGIIVRHIDGSMLRVTISLPEENQLFLSALQDVLGASR